MGLAGAVASRRVVFSVAIPGMPVDSTRSHEPFRMMDTQRLIALIVFSFSALLLWEAWQKQNAPAPVAHTAPATAPATVPTLPAAQTDGRASHGSAVSAAPPTATASSAPAAPIHVTTDLLDVDIDPVGGDIRRVTLRQVHSAQDRDKPLTLLEPNPEHFFIAQSGLLGDDLPNHNSVYEADQRTYSMTSGSDQVEVRLRARDAGGNEVMKRYVFHRGEYRFDLSYTVTNHGSKPLSAYAYYQFLRDSNAPSQEAAQTSSFGGVTTFTGPAVYTDESKYEKIAFKDVDKGKQPEPRKAKDGWIAIVQHYFVSAWVPKPGEEREFFTRRVGDNRYTAGVVVPLGTIAPGGKASVDVAAYIGPQEKDRLAKVAPGMDLVVDYGWLKVLAVPIFWILKTIHGFVHNWGWSIILLTILIKLTFYPLNAKAGRSMAQMKVLGPKMEKLKQLYGEDRQKLNQAMMELYRTEKINPLGGCLPIVVQIPVFIALYWVLLGSIELRHAPWLGWIHDLSAPDPYFVLPIIYAASMFLQTRINPQPADPVQAKVMMIMPIMFSVFFLFFPSGLVLYWVVQNLLSIVQQWHINRTLAAEAKAKSRR
ncbi:MAG TPA: membrane protein insertase YidC [Usitatibacter sp.]|jgi:YidC/Oxa1 family membrane protein insertase|nr:membrane protein insertase YidC [Usitatibacter sp.]